MTEWPDDFQIFQRRFCVVGAKHNVETIVEIDPVAHELYTLSVEETIVREGWRDG